MRKARRQLFSIFVGMSVFFYDCLGPNSLSAHAMSFSEAAQKLKSGLAITVLKVAHPISVYQDSRLISVNPTGSNVLLKFEINYLGGFTKIPYTLEVLLKVSQNGIEDLTFGEDTGPIPPGLVSGAVLSLLNQGLDHVNTASSYNAPSPVYNSSVLKATWFLKVGTYDWPYTAYMQQSGRNLSGVLVDRNGKKFPLNYGSVEKTGPTKWVFSFNEGESQWMGMILKSNDAYVIKNGVVRHVKTGDFQASYFGSLKLVN